MTNRQAYPPILAIALAVAMAAGPQNALAAPRPAIADSSTSVARIFERSIHGTYETGKDETSAQFPSKAPVRATGRAGGSGGYVIKRFKARYRALAKWRVAAADRYGPGATRWTLAKQKNIRCDARLGKVTCTVSAHPATVLERLGLVKH